MAEESRPAPAEPPPLPPRDLGFLSSESIPAARDFAGNPVDTSHYDPPPRRPSGTGQVPDDVAPPLVYTRNVDRFIGFLVPFPVPQLSDCLPSDTIPQRFFIYTPPSRPFADKPDKDAMRKEGLPEWCRRKWLEELREAKTRQSKGKTGKTSLWRRGKWKATLATDWGIDKTKTSNLEFLNRAARMQDEANSAAEDCYRTHVSPEEILLLYPPSLTAAIETGLEDKWLRDEFIASLMRTRKSATRDTIIATLLFPPSIVIDTLAVPIWPFGGLAEIDAVWLYASFRGAKTSRTITKRLDVTNSAKQDRNSTKTKKSSLQLSFTPNNRLDVLQQYLAAKCHEKDSQHFPEYVPSPSEAQVLEAIGWSHSQDSSEMSWEDRQWEMQQAKDDLRRTFAKGAKEWAGLCKKMEKKAVKDDKKAKKKE